MRRAWGSRMTILLVVIMVLSMSLSAMAMTGQDVVDRVKDEYGDFQSQVVTMHIKTYDGKSLVTDREVILLTRKSGDV